MFFTPFQFKIPQIHRLASAWAERDMRGKAGLLPWATVLGLKCISDCSCIISVTPLLAVSAFFAGGGAWNPVISSFFTFCFIQNFCSLSFWRNLLWLLFILHIISLEKSYSNYHMYKDTRKTTVLDSYLIKILLQINLLIACFEQSLLF